MKKIAVFTLLMCSLFMGVAQAHTTQMPNPQDLLKAKTGCPEKIARYLGPGEPLRDASGKIIKLVARWRIIIFDTDLCVKTSDFEFDHECCGSPIRRANMSGEVQEDINIDDLVRIMDAHILAEDYTDIVIY